MKTAVRLILMVMVVLFFAHCASNETANSDTVKQSEIYQSYSVTYNSGEKELTATASFRFGGANGTTLLLVKPSKVIFENEEMPNEQNIFSGTFYEINKQTTVQPEYTYTFTDCEEKPYTNNALMIPVEISKCPETTDKSEGLTIEWSYPLQNGESIHLFIEDKNNGSATVCTNVFGATSISLNPEDLKKLKPGEVSVYLERENSTSLKNATHLGGNMFVKYISKKAGLKLTGPEYIPEGQSDTAAEK
ncbi:MAG: hypothetical protein PHR81_11240 [Bacteroidales bacterium]|jgi:hypothetical protein|nr:hypothetical protein [Bacteroidales bacterium]MDD4215375.1 hypothetical protein [Bacteroidales bacterium]